MGSQKANGGIVIRDVEAEAAAAAAKGKGKAAVGGEEDRRMEADEDFARQLQAKMDAEMRAKWVVTRAEQRVVVAPAAALACRPALWTPALDASPLDSLTSPWCPTRGACRRPGAAKAAKGAQAYMRVSEAEIADDYPVPQVGAPRPCSDRPPHWLAHSLGDQVQSNRAPLRKARLAAGSLSFARLLLGSRDWAGLLP